MPAAKVKFLGFHHKEGDGKYRSGLTPAAGVDAQETFEVPDQTNDRGAVVKTGTDRAKALVDDYEGCGPGGKGSAFVVVTK